MFSKFSRPFKKRVKGSHINCASGSPETVLDSLPCFSVCVNGVKVNALIDTGSGRTMVLSELNTEVTGSRAVSVIMMNGKKMFGLFR